MSAETDTALVCATNWLGDSIMSMPAVELLARESRVERVVLLAKPGIAPLWRMNESVTEIIELERGLRGVIRAASATKKMSPAEAFVLPNSFRSALVPFLAAVPRRTGTSGHAREWMLTDIVNYSGRSQDSHQSREYFELMGVPPGSEAPTVPLIRLRENACSRAAELLGGIDTAGAVALVPGAARGTAKQWPPERFAAVGRRLAETGRRILVLGSRDEVSLCGKVSDEVGDGALDISGRTGIPEFAALLGMCDVAVTNDSGGMHLAAAVGARVVAVFGMTDPRRTGPLGSGHRVICAEGVVGSRDIASRSTAAERALRSIEPEEVVQAVLSVLDT